MKIEKLHKSNLSDFLSLFDECSCKDCYCTALYAQNWDMYDPQSVDNRSRRVDLVDRGCSDGYLFYLGNDLIGWVQVAKSSELPNLKNITTVFEAHPGLVITCFKVNPKYRNQGLSTKMIGLIVVAAVEAGEDLYSIPTQYSDEFNEYRSWTGTVGCFSRNGFIEIENGADGTVVMKKSHAEHI